MNFGGIIAGAIGGGATAATQLADDQIKREDQMAKEQRHAAVRRDEQAFASKLSLERFNAEADRKAAPMKRLQGMLQTEAGEQVPQEAAPVTMLSGQGNAFDGKPLTQGGLVGDRNKLIADAMAMPDGEDKRNILAQLGNEITADTASAQGLVAGQMRKRTGDETFEAAMAKAKTTDPEAYAAGMPLEPSKTTTVAPGASVINNKTGKVLFSGTDEAERKRNWEAQKLAITEDGRDRRSTERSDAADKRNTDRIAAMIEKSTGVDKADNIQSTQIDGDGYLVGIFRNGTGRRLTDPEGNPITSAAFEKRVDQQSKQLKENGGAKYRKMEPAELRTVARDSLLSADRSTPRPPKTSDNGASTSTAPPGDANRASQFKVIR